MNPLPSSPQLLLRGSSGVPDAGGRLPPINIDTDRRDRGGSGGDDFAPGGTPRAAQAKVGLWVFFGVVSVVFSILANVYLARMKMPDWQPLPDPALLWWNTAILVIASLAMQWASLAIRRGELNAAQTAFAAGGVGAVLFLAGQLWAWQELIELGYFVTTNPANSFFYLITALHGLHLLGGVVAWGYSTIKLARGADAALNMVLCARYWHFLLIVWMVLYGLMLST
jgi:cytochrome c oxidase subunit 3